MGPPDMEPTAQAAEGAAQVSSGVNIANIIDKSGIIVYFAVAMLAVWGIYNAIMLYRNLAKKTLPSNESEALLNQIREQILTRNDTKAAIDACMNPSHWHSALAQVLAVGLKNRHKGLGKVKQMMIMDFQAEVVSPLEGRVGTLGTASRLGPLIGLVGTVLSMIAAFARMSAAGKPDPVELAGSISLGLWTTAAGLLLAVPLMCFGNDVLIRLRRLRDRTDRNLQEFIEILEQAEAKSGRPARAAHAAAR